MSFAAATSTAPATASRTKGFTTLERETRLDDLPLQGEIPAWLTGSLLRTGPARFEVGTQPMRHWFDGLAMLHRFSIAGGRVSYANRFLESRSYRAARDTGRLAFGEFATDPCRSLFKRVQSVFSPGGALTDNANVNLVKLGERFIAMTETPIAVQFDERTLAAAGVGYRAPGHLSTAHPHSDRATGSMLNFAARLGPRSTYRFFSLAPDSTEPKVIASLPVDQPSYMHSFGLTERWLVLAEFPFVVNPLRLATSGRPYIENYRWKPERGTRFTLVDRRTGEARAGFNAPPCFAFHHINSYEDGDQVVVDLCAFADATIIEDLYLDRLRAGKPISPAAPTRFRLSLSDRSVTSERLGDAGLELPRINYGRCNERPYRYVWGNDAGASGWIDQIVKLDTRTGRTQQWSAPDCYPGEPVFVARPQSDGEDDGVLLSVVLDGAAGSSFLLILDAATLEQVARAEVPHHIPFGFHGQFARE